MDEVTVWGRAKINLILRVGPRRADGFHEIQSVMQTVDLHDELTLKHSKTNRVNLSWAKGLSGTLPDEPDLVAETIKYLVESVGARLGLSIDVVKRIPVAAGLGGGSADAAAAILGVDALLETNVPTPRLLELCSAMGSDVPFAMEGGTAFVEGRGELITSVACYEPLWWVLGISEKGLPTANVYDEFDSLGAPSGFPQDLEDLKMHLATGDVDEIGGFLANDLEPAAFSLEGSLKRKKDLLIEAGAVAAVMTGSGSTIAALCRDEEGARLLAKKIKAKFKRVEVVTNVHLGTEVVH